MLCAITFTPGWQKVFATGVPRSKPMETGKRFSEVRRLLEGCRMLAITRMELGNLLEQE